MQIASLKVNTIARHAKKVDIFIVLKLQTGQWMWKATSLDWVLVEWDGLAERIGL